MGSVYDPIQGPYLKHAFAKSVHKGEDFWLQQRAISTNDVGAATFDAFGIFDGHGGKLAAQYASKNLVNHVVGALDGISPSPDVTAPVEEQLQQLMTKELADSTSQLVSDVDKQAWRAQDVLVDKLPQALSRGFEETQKDFWSRSKVSGTTATVVALVGWEVVVANVGDSCAVLDTGSEVVQISGNHRLEDNKAEQRRCTDAGCDISTSVLEGKNVGPLRVWPGGLAMSRTIGDYDAGEVVLAEPEVRQVTLPHTGGRIIIASDGLWDAVSLKTAAHHVRGLPASKAANDLVQMSLKSRGLRDDITVLVVDTMPSQEGRLPPLLARHNTGHGLAFPDEQADAVTIHKPLEADSHVPWRKFVWERRAAAVEAALAPRRASRPMDISPDASQCSSGTHVSDSLLSASTSPGDAMSLADTVGSLMSDGMPDTYRELADLKAVPFNFQSAIIPEGEEDDGWETVGKPAKSESPTAPVTPRSNHGVPGKLPAVHAGAAGAAAPSDWQAVPSKAQKDSLLSRAVPGARNMRNRGSHNSQRVAADAAELHGRRDYSNGDRQNSRGAGRGRGGRGPIIAGRGIQNNSRAANTNEGVHRVGAAKPGTAAANTDGIRKAAVVEVPRPRRANPRNTEAGRQPGPQRGFQKAKPGPQQQRLQASAGQAMHADAPAGSAVQGFVPVPIPAGPTVRPQLQFGSFEGFADDSHAVLRPPQLQFGTYTAPGSAQPPPLFFPHSQQQQHETGGFAGRGPAQPGGPGERAVRRSSRGSAGRGGGRGSRPAPVRRAAAPVASS